MEWAVASRGAKNTKLTTRPLAEVPKPIATELSNDRQLAAFLHKAQTAHDALGQPQPDEIWYRGQANKVWRLVPGLHRWQNGLKRERQAYQEWVRRAELIEKPEDNEWAHLFNMQHFGVPTRLLDWTESFAVAIGFSLIFSNYGASSIPRVWLLNPKALNNRTTGRDRVFEIPADDSLSYRKTYLEGEGVMPVGPVAIRPSSYSRNRRADNQSGVFTIHDNRSNPVDDQPGEVVASFAIEHDEILGARLFLKFSHVNAYTIYPDFAGLAGYIRGILTGEREGSVQG
jgi:FRG domain